MKRRSLFPFLCLSGAVGLLPVFPLGAAEKAPEKIFVDPAKVDDPDFAIQGEYQGTLGDQPWGVQVIALGNGKFDFVAYPGGLPGAGWEGETADGEADRVKGTGQRGEDGQVVLRPNSDNGGKGVVAEGKLKVWMGEEEEPVGSLSRVERKSLTLGKKAPENAVVLFDGTNADAWKGKGENLMDGNLLVQGVTSKETFRDFHLHMEFRTPYKPAARGQGRGNSGFYAQGRYEVQILDSFGLEGKQNECGGIYSVGEPRLNMCLPPLTWQTYDVDFTSARYDAEGKKTSHARLTVRHNGALIHDDIVADHATTASPLKEGPEPGPIFFQDHGNPVRFRNVWVLKK